jgi:uncharacterized SAM-binding protein YcdF (DUF218 family)
MYFILSKILLFILLPLYWVIALLLTGLILKNPKRKKRFFIVGLVLLYLCSAPVFLKAFQAVWDVKPYPANDTTKYSCVIVLGGFSSGGGQDGGHFNNSADRFIQGTKLVTTKQASHILISGGTGELIPGAFREAAWVRIQLLKFNVPDSAILVENKSKNTIENARYSKVLLQQKHLPPPYLLVTSSYHMRRSLMIFEKAGVPVVPYTCNYSYGKIEYEFNDFLPEANTLTKWESYTKEVVGYAVNYFKH